MVCDPTPIGAGGRRERAGDKVQSTRPAALAVLHRLSRREATRRVSRSEVEDLVVALLEKDRPWTRGNDHPADVLAVDLMKRGANQGRHVLAHGSQQKLGQKELETVPVRFLERPVIGLQTDDCSIVTDPDEQRSTVSVEEACDGETDDRFELRVLLSFAQIPADGGLEFQLRTLPLVDQGEDLPVSRSRRENLVG